MFFAAGPLALRSTVVGGCCAKAAAEEPTLTTKANQVSVGRKRSFACIGCKTLKSYVRLGCQPSSCSEIGCISIYASCLLERNLIDGRACSCLGSFSSISSTSRCGGTRRWAVGVITERIAGAADPEPAGDGEGDDLKTGPPGRLVAMAVQVVVMLPAQDASGPRAEIGRTDGGVCAHRRRVGG